MSVDVDPGDLDAWVEVDDVCDATLDVVVDGTVVRLRCEVDGDHEDHEATLRWTATP